MVGLICPKCGTDKFIAYEYSTYICKNPVKQNTDGSWELCWHHFSTQKKGGRLNQYCLVPRCKSHRYGNYKLCKEHYISYRRWALQQTTKSYKYEIFFKSIGIQQ